MDASYTWSKSLDTNSLNSSNFAVQDGYDIPNQYGLSDFDARHRFVLSAIYQLPLPESAWTRGWQLAAIVQSQSGNPVNIVTRNSTLNGVPNTVRPDLVAPIRIIGTVDSGSIRHRSRPSIVSAISGRNVVIGPAFHNTDLSLMKNCTSAEHCRLQFRVDVFDLFNHPNFGPPGNIVGSPSFGRITRTRMATGEGGSSRQIQLAGEAVVLMRLRSLTCAYLAAAAVVATLLLAPPASAQQAIKNVLIVHGGPEAFPGNAGFDAALRRCCSPTRRCKSTRTPRTGERGIRGGGEVVAAQIHPKQVCESPSGRR